MTHTAHLRQLWNLVSHAVQRAYWPYNREIAAAISSPVYTQLLSTNRVPSQTLGLRLRSATRLFTHLHSASDSRLIRQVALIRESRALLHYVRR